MIDGGRLAIIHGRVILPDRVIHDAVLVVSGSRISHVGDRTSLALEDNVPSIDAMGGFICPGFVDLHVNGGGGRDATEGTESAITGIAEGHARVGTTGLLVAITGPTQEIAKAGLRAIAAVARSRTHGARILGAHMEGPFVNPKRQGPVFRGYDDVATPSVSKMKEFVEAADGFLKIVTMAPELPGAFDVIEYLISEGVRVSIGHTEATADQVDAAIKAGASYAAHIFNAMSGIHHREPGAAVGLLTSPETFVVEVVADGHHVHPSVLRLVVRAKGVGGIVLASDATEVVGTDQTSFVLPIGGGLRVAVRDGRTWGPDGQLIGSVLQMNEAIRNLERWCAVGLPAAVAAGSLQPARVVGVDNSIGSLKVGKEADVSVLDPEFQVIATIVGGEVVHTRRQ